MIVAGFGFRAAADVAACKAALALAQGGHPAVTALAAPHDKAALLAPLASALDVPLIAVTPEMLRSITTPTRSHFSLEARGTGSVAEAAALAAAGPDARLLTRRHVSPNRMATCAIAQGPAA
ncbi:MULTISPECIES: cobalamin biosynthesis protein [unclassified Sphingomonas]|uniref:cobalamin biosynthesis protein n=1 Tax=unclassified Sphingomonas TaxID=196159 RepID=UPI0006FB7739|nr:MULTISPECIES: cobalamin biosynthesis protein [unclassified Sphingomonas]KQS51401.1 precorrin methylase [Sphingomonas sp. Leaf198]